MSVHLELTHTIYTLDQIQNWPAPQVTVSGRSNVGKSSLINVLAGRRSLAKTSSSPGKTRSINLYWISEFQGYLVDLPGYGYARRSKKERELWARLVDHYFQSNIVQVKGVMVLIDSRLNPQQLDLELISSLRARQMPIMPILTKVDKTKMGWRSRIQRTWKDLAATPDQPLLFSAKTGQGARELIHCLHNLMQVNTGVLDPFPSGA
ncbi:MAG: ribosome biogenesis GTP-binding protein YihA/YsxC [Desulfovermiculus sp.]